MMMIRLPESGRPPTIHVELVLLVQYPRGRIVLYQPPPSRINIQVLSRPEPEFEPMENGTGSEGRDPSGFLSEIIGAPVTVKLNSGVVYKGADRTFSWRPSVGSN